MTFFAPTYPKRENAKKRKPETEMAKKYFFRKSKKKVLKTKVVGLGRFMRVPFMTFLAPTYHKREKREK